MLRHWKARGYTEDDPYEWLKKRVITKEESDKLDHIKLRTSVSQNK